MKTPELNPCPHCGKTPGFAYLYRRSKSQWKQLLLVELSHACKGFAFICQCGTEKEAAEAWNRRVTDV